MSPPDLSPEEITRSHRWHAIECNNRAWALCDSPHRTPVEDEEMLNAAHASAYHWDKAGTDLSRARAKMLLGHVHAAFAAGNGDLYREHFARATFNLIPSPEKRL